MYSFIQNMITAVHFPQFLLAMPLSIDGLNAEGAGTFMEVRFSAGIQVMFLFVLRLFTLIDSNNM